MSRGGDRRSARAPMAKGMARPGKRKLQQSISLDPDLHAEIAVVAEERGISFSEAVRLLVEWGLEAA